MPSLARRSLDPVARKCERAASISEAESCSRSKKFDLLCLTWLHWHRKVLAHPMKTLRLISLILQKMLAHFCWITCNMFLLGASGGSWGGHTNRNGAKSEWLYLSQFGPKMLVARNGQVQYLMNAFAIEVEYDSADESGHVLSCKPLLMKLEKGDKVTFGFTRVYREHAKLQCT